MHELKEWGKCQAPLLSSAPGSSFHGFSIPVQLYWPFMISSFVSQVFVGISCSFIIFFVSVVFVTGSGN